MGKKDSNKVAAAPAVESKQEDGDKVPRSGHRGNPALEGLIKSGALRLQVGSRACFNVNPLNYIGQEQLAAAIAEIDPDFVRPEHGNWFTCTILDEFGTAAAKYSDTLAPATEIYAQLNPGQNFGSYCVVKADIDFAQLGISKEDIENGYGVIFIGDSNNSPDRVVGRIRGPHNVSFRPDRRPNFIRPVAGTKDSVTCVFRNRGTIIIYTVAGAIEKRKDEWQPLIKMWKIEVSSYRNMETYDLHATKIGRVTESEQCVEDVIRYLLKNLQFQKVERDIDNQHSYEYTVKKQIVHALGGDLRVYLPKTDDRRDFGPGGRSLNKHYGRRHEGVDYASEAGSRQADEVAPEEEVDEGYEDEQVESGEVAEVVGEEAGAEQQ